MSLWDLLFPRGNQVDFPESYNPESERWKRFLELVAPEGDPYFYERQQEGPPRPSSLSEYPDVTQELGERLPLATTVGRRIPSRGTSREDVLPPQLTAALEERRRPPGWIRSKAGIDEEVPSGSPSGDISERYGPSDRLVRGGPIDPRADRSGGGTLSAPAMTPERKKQGWGQTDEQLGFETRAFELGAALAEVANPESRKFNPAQAKLLKEEIEKTYDKLEEITEGTPRFRALEQAATFREAQTRKEQAEAEREEIALGYARKGEPDPARLAELQARWGNTTWTPTEEPIVLDAPDPARGVTIEITTASGKKKYMNRTGYNSYMRDQNLGAQR